VTIDHLGPAAFATAFAAGFLSFASPCVLPLIPGYLCFASGVGFNDLPHQTRRVTTATAAFVAGFSLMFVLLGAGVSWFGTLLLTNRRPLEIAAGAFLVLAGLIYAGLPLPPQLLRERRARLGGRPGTLPTATLAGAAFAIGWTPCIGPTLAAILTLAATSGQSAQGALLLAVYSLGLGLPFLLAGLAFTRALALTRTVRRHRRAVALASGTLMVAFGVVLALGDLTQITARLST
jgi:cytochrome c-type biogenesis protein